MNKELLNKNSTRLLNVVLFSIYLFNLLLIFKPSLNLNVWKFVFSNEFFLSSVALSYPIYIIGFYINLSRNYMKSKNVLFTYFFIFINIISFISTLIIRYIEYVNFPNFVYSTYHIYTPYLIRFSYYEFGLILLGFYFIYAKRNNLKADFINGSLSKIVMPSKIVYLFVFLLVYRVLFVDFIPSIVDEYHQQVNARNMKVDFKFRTTDMPQLAVKAEFLRKHTDEESVVVNPPQSWDYSDIGNQVLMRYFLFPRTLVSYSKLNKYISENSNNCKLYSIVSRGYVNKNDYFPDSDKLDISKLSLLLNNGEVKIYFDLNNDKLKKLVLDDNVMIGVLESKKCIQF